MTADARDRSVDPICVRVREAVRLTGLSRSRVYELMKSGDIEFVKVGSSTLIPYDALRSFIEKCRDPRLSWPPAE